MCGVVGQLATSNCIDAIKQNANEIVMCAVSDFHTIIEVFKTLTGTTATGTALATLLKLLQMFYHRYE